VRDRTATVCLAEITEKYAAGAVSDAPCGLIGIANRRNNAVRSHAGDEELRRMKIDIKVCVTFIFAASPLFSQKSALSAELRFLGDIG
jgi:hypothetical protein